MQCVGEAVALKRVCQTKAQKLKTDDPMIASSLKKKIQNNHKREILLLQLICNAQMDKSIKKYIKKVTKKSFINDEKNYNERIQHLFIKKK